MDGENRCPVEEEDLAVHTLDGVGTPAIRPTAQLQGTQQNSPRSMQGRSSTVIDMAEID